MKALTQNPEQIKNGQIKQLTRMVSDVADSEPVQQALADLDKEGAERVKGNPEFAESLRQYTVQRIQELSVPNEYANEEVESQFGYLSGYTPGVMDLDRQITVLARLFPGLGGVNPDYLEKVKSGAEKLPTGAEKFAAIPNWKKHPELFGGKTYNDAVQKVLDLVELERKGKFINHRKGHIGPDQLRQSKRSKAFWSKLIEEQGNSDILIVPIQFGIRHRGRSVRRAIVRMQLNEFGLGAFAVGICLLTHPERLKHFDDLWIDCAGDEYDDPGSGVRFGRSPFFFGVRGVGIGFGASFVDSAAGSYGAASGFVPQKEPRSS